MGHVHQGTTDKNYTHEPLEFLLTEINKINICYTIVKLTYKKHMKLT